MTRRGTPPSDLWALKTRAAITVSRGRVNVVVNATLSPGSARELARRLLEAADDADGETA